VFIRAGICFNVPLRAVSRFAARPMLMSRKSSPGPGRPEAQARPGEAAPREITPWRGQGKPPRAREVARRAEGGRGAPAFRRPSGDVVALYGFHAVRAALTTGRRKLLDLWATPPAAEKLAAEIAAAGLTARPVSNDDLARRLGAEAVHQGVMLEARPIAPIDLSEIETNSGVVLVLDQVTDPHNFGAILRTAAAFAVDALVTTERHAPDLAGALAKAASGGLEHVPVASVVNLARALEELGEMGYLRVGLDSDGPAALDDAPLARPVALVLGAEGKGLRRLSRENCDILARLDMPGAVRSLNVSNACAVALTILRLKLATA
jgi:23S rRNA (guanosine2251-2'-O)-methyltransferase